MIRRLDPGEEARLDGFLARHWATSMFLRANVAAHGLSGVGHRHATTVWAQEEAGQITGVMGCTQAGLLLVQAPDAPAAFWTACRQALTQRAVLGGSGVPDQLEALCAALGLAEQGYGKASDDPLMVCEFAHLTPATGPGAMRPGQPDDLPWLSQWFEDYALDTGLGAAAANNAQDLAQRFIDEGKGRLWILKDQPVAMTNFNARLRDMVQLGGVYTPAAQRRNGYAARVISAHLDEVARDGVSRAILFAASPKAAALYASLGFQTHGRYALRLLTNAHKVTP